MSALRVCLIGVGGYARVHLRHLTDFHRDGHLQFVAAVALPGDIDDEVRAVAAKCHTRLFASFDELCAALPELKIDLGVVPTPIHLHATMSARLLRAGLHVLVEKPLTAGLGELETLLRAEAESGRRIAVGFQYLHGREIRALRGALSAGAIGRVRRMSVHVAWPRSHSYYTRNDWAGRRHVEAGAVFDSPATNAMAHFLMLMLHLAAEGEASAVTPSVISAELYRAQAIETFDTCVLHYRVGDLRLDLYGTHSSREVRRPSLLIEGELGRAEWVQDSHALIDGPLGQRRLDAEPEPSTREHMLRDVLAHFQGGDAFICTGKMAGAHVQSTARLHEHGLIHDVPAEMLRTREEGGQVFTYVEGLDAQLLAASRDGANLRESGAVWASAPQVMPL